MTVQFVNPYNPPAAVVEETKPVEEAEPLEEVVEEVVEEPVEEKPAPRSRKAKG